MNTANKITVIRMLMVPLFLVLAYLGKTIPSFIVFVLACLTDIADGYIARNYNQVSNFGMFMDPLADKILVISAMCYFTQMQRMPGWVVAIVCLREFSVSGLRMLVAEKNKVIYAAKSGKIKTALTMIGLSAMLIINSRTIDIAVCIIILVTTVYSGVEYFIKNKSVFGED